MILIKAQIRTNTQKEPFKITPPRDLPTNRKINHADIQKNIYLKIKIKKQYFYCDIMRRRWFNIEFLMSYEDYCFFF